MWLQFSNCKKIIFFLWKEMQNESVKHVERFAYRNRFPLFKQVKKESKGIKNRICFGSYNFEYFCYTIWNRRRWSITKYIMKMMILSQVVLKITWSLCRLKPRHDHVQFLPSLWQDRDYWFVVSRSIPVSLTTNQMNMTNQSSMTKYPVPCTHVSLSWPRLSTQLIFGAWDRVAICRTNNLDQVLFY